jgi:hypothetical protein
MLTILKIRKSKDTFFNIMSLCEAGGQAGSSLTHLLAGKFEVRLEPWAVRYVHTAYRGAYNRVPGFQVNTKTIVTLRKKIAFRTIFKANISWPFMKKNLRP